MDDKWIRVVDLRDNELGVGDWLQFMDVLKTHDALLFLGLNGAKMDGATRFAALALYVYT